MRSVQRNILHLLVHIQACYIMKKGTLKHCPLLSFQDLPFACAVHAFVYVLRKKKPSFMLMESAGCSEALLCQIQTNDLVLKQNHMEN